MTTNSPPINPYFALISGVLAVSTGAIFARLADAPVLVIAAYRVGLATIILFVCYGTSAVILWVIVLSFNLQISGFGSGTVTAFWAMAIIPQLIGHSSYNWALKWLSASLIAVSLLGEPIGSTILAYFIFDEGLTWQKAIGGVLILFAIYLAGTAERKVFA